MINILQYYQFNNWSFFFSFTLFRKSSQIWLEANQSLRLTRSEEVSSASTSERRSDFNLDFDLTLTNTDVYVSDVDKDSKDILEDPKTLKYIIKVGKFWIFLESVPLNLEIGYVRRRPCPNFQFWFESLQKIIRSRFLHKCDLKCKTLNC